MELEDAVKNNLNTAKEIVLDEEKIVTYISLSKDLCIHINTSKLLLQNLVDKIHKENPKILLNVVYIISGIVGDNRVWTTVCAADNLEKLRLKFTSIFYEHIYSVNKGNSTVDQNMYLLLNTFNDFNLCAGLIKSKECDKRTSNEIVNLKTNSQELLTFSDDKKPLIPAKKVKQESKQTLNLKSEIKEERSKPLSTQENEVNIKIELSSPQKKSNGQKIQKGISGFFNKTNGAVKKAPKEIKKETKFEGNVNVPDQKMDVDEADSPKATLNAPVKEESESESNLSTNEKSNKNKILQEIKKTSKVDKKRKRVLHVSDSESDAENDPFVDNQEINNESDDEIPPTPLNNTIKITSGIVNPKKRRKVIDKTYTDDDGYILTRKEEVYESCSENEQEVEVAAVIKPLKLETKENSPIKKKNSPKASKKKISPPQKGKQSTLTSFFKKK